MLGITIPLYGQTNNSFNKDSLISYMNEIGIKYVNFSYGQAVHESANFRSDIFIHNNNLFGMRLPEYRRTLAIGKRRGYAVYSSWKDSVMDFYIMQQGILKKHETYSSYLSYIFRNYAKDPNYRNKLQKYVK